MSFEPNVMMTRQIDSKDFFNLFALFMTDVNDDFVETDFSFKIALGGGVFIELQKDCQYYIDYSTGCFYARTNNELLHYVYLGCFSLRPEHYSVDNVYIKRLIAAQGDREHCLKLCSSDNILTLFCLVNNKNLTLQDYDMLSEQMERLIFVPTFNTQVTNTFLTKVVLTIFDGISLPCGKKALKKLCAHTDVRKQFFCMLENELTSEDK